MFPPLLQLLTGLAVLTVTLSAGLFLTFSDFVMRSLRASAPTTGIQAMQMINREIMKSVTITLLLGNAGLTAGLAVFCYFITPDSAATTLLMAASAFYILGVLGLSFVFNVPMNNKLDKMAPNSPEAESYWQIYVSRWTFWNTGRVLATLASAICLLLAIPSLTS